MRGHRESAFGEGMAASLGEEKLQCRHGSVCQRERGVLENGILLWKKEATL